ncbi:RNA polymerase factor sigma-70 RpoD [Gottschalkia purinilytica]|uniref:RNA polymerase factor sigma-70 RpoD n=1 Tax=Gottschalkia purinilytica TaxID=1503 RepID=A0A0L0W7L2_GOTPU|nr:sigma-70 family RNA polymerase sigma factor [Gottschalkia purinilytica]KNF07499.1 RNA polymerase factor sigma-70 RpoD [Gottschalkia purinilytica]
MNEEQIIKEIQNGNYSEFSQIVDLYKNKVFGMAYKFTNDYDEAQDLSQEVFLKIYKQIKNFRFESKLSTWIYRICMNTCIDWKRKKEKIKSINFSNMTSEENKDQQIEIKDESLLPEDKIVANEKSQEIHNLIYSLPDKYKTVITMYHFNEMSYEDIAEVLNVPQRTIETRLYRARRILKEKLSKTVVRGEPKWNAEK